MAPIRLQLLVIHANHSATETSMYVCIHVCMYAFMYVCMSIYVCISIMYMYMSYPDQNPGGGGNIFSTLNIIDGQRRVVVFNVVQPLEYYLSV